MLRYFLFIFFVVSITFFALNSRSDQPLQSLIFLAEEQGNAISLQEVSEQVVLPIDSTSELLRIDENFLQNYNSLMLVGTLRENLPLRQSTEIERFIEAGGKLLEMEEWDAQTALKFVESVQNQALPDYSQVSTVAIPAYNRFSKEVLHQRFDEPMELAVMDNGNVLIVERKGAVKMYDAISQSMQKVGQIPANDFEEDGLLGVALDPNFTQNRWIYLFYSPIGEVPQQYVSRFEFRDSVIMESEKILLKIPTQRLECCHSAGSLEFGPKGYLWISTGDNTSPFQSNGFNPIDEREGRYPFDAQRSSGNANDLRGKILRIKPELDGTYSIPDGNLFPKDGSQGRPEIYIMGCRNPFRFSIDEKTYYLYWGEVGPDANTPEEGRGPKGYDELNQAKGPGNFGWPYFIADNKPYRYAKFIRGEGEGNGDVEIAGSEIAFNPAQPVNQSPNNTGVNQLPPAQPAFIFYPYTRSAEFPELGAGSRNAMAGPIYYSEKYRSPNAFPSYFDGKVFFYDWMRNWVFLVKMDSTAALERLEAFAPQIAYNNLMDMEFGPNGTLYVLEYGTGWFLENADARLSKIVYNPGNRPPVVEIAANKLTGSVPLSVAFTSQAIDYDGDELTYKWWFDSEAPQSSEANPNFTFERAGRFQVLLQVTDAQGAVSKAQIEIQAGNEAPNVDIQFADIEGFSGNKSFWWKEKSIQYAVQVSDKEDGQVGKGISEEKVNFTLEVLPLGEDYTSIFQGHQKGASKLTVEELIENSNCQSCHDIQKRLVGPGFMEVAMRYANQKDAKSYLTQKILKGGSGVWGAQAMAAQAQLSEAEASRISTYILELAQKKEDTSKPIAGEVNTARIAQGNIVMEATYRDRGSESADPISGSKQLILRADGWLEAENFTEAKGIIPKQFERDQTPYLDNLRPGNYVMYDQIDLTSVTSIRYQWRDAWGSGAVEMRIGSPEGELLCSFAHENGQPKLSAIQPIVPQQGFHDIYLVFTHPQGDQQVGVLDAIQFLP